VKHSVFAVATPLTPAVRGVVRCSGHLLFDDLLPWFAKYADQGALLFERSVQNFSCRLLGGVDVTMTALVFCGPNSATGENVIEFHLPGNPVLVQALENSLAEFGLSPAEPGEFTRRAFLNGRLDLSQAEAVLELVQSRSVDSARAATQLLCGGLGAQMSAVRDELLASLVELEAALDFEEGDSQDLLPTEISNHVGQAQNILSNAQIGQKNRTLNSSARFGCLLYGPPNAGKSTLFEYLTGVPSLISEQAGTTRDYRRAEWISSASDFQLDVIDFPGLGGTPVDERDASARKVVADFKQADLCLFCLHPNSAISDLPLEIPDMPVLVVFTHADLKIPISLDLQEALRHRFGENYREISVGKADESAAVATNLLQAILPFFEEAEQLIAQRIRNGERYQEALSKASCSVTEAQRWLESGGQQDLVAAEIRNALDVLAELVGEMTPDDVLDRLFSAFCVGK